ncbi:MAG TPA: molybdenum ABC transporter ATP-binding protein [Burkholderiales bacterium]|jgi:molybdate transport system ATP-binding protein|nr:molybdenum ABC transporter ATP-binding protein [Burkholderiales bacterium]
MLEIDVEKQLGAFRLRVQAAADGRVVALFGRSGSGKTTLANVIAGLVRPDRGRVVLDGRVLHDSERGIDVPAHRRRVGYVFQEGRLFPHLTVRNNLLYGLRRTMTADRTVDLKHVVDLLGIDHVLDRRPGDLSGGEKQRVAIGRALLTSPRILLMDEPLASLDVHRRNEVLQHIELLRDEFRIPIIYVSHVVEEVVRLADAVVLMGSGRAVAVGGVEEIMGRPDLRAAAGTFEAGAVVDAKVVGQDVQYDLATLAFDGGVLTVTNLDALIGEPVRVRIRARDVSLALDSPSRISIQNVLRGNVADITTARDGIVDVSVEVGGVTLRSRITQRAAEQLALRPGLEVYAMVKAVSLDRLGAK